MSSLFTMVECITTISQSNQALFSSQVLNVPPGHISLYEYNIDRNATTNPLIYPFVYKNSDKTSFKNH